MPRLLVVRMSSANWTASERWPVSGGKPQVCRVGSGCDTRSAIECGVKPSTKQPATLHEEQPAYDQWLGDLFGVQKKA
ncbi:hypothetical protein JQ621_12930 [Bradyrhizobium manausense]|uniref:hypothetical protein n=1 Tax=Bradyrhizobium manausense TaxID=989370 RepID=UPI001BAB73E6|nr:hypothetical protein [Bradyrhizobium manausense]MBR1088368.1 hypothetical protein [Bradyrhizobium manausense]